MTALDEAERKELAALFRLTSPLRYVPEAAIPPTWLASLRNASLPRRPKAVLFDLYGTLFSSSAGGEPGLAKDGSESSTAGRDGSEGEAAKILLEKELHAIGVEMDPAAFAEEVAVRIVEFRHAALERHPHPEIDIEGVVGSILGGAEARAIRRLALLLEAWKNPCAPMPGALALIDRLGRRSIRLGIVSNAQFYTPLLFEALFGAPPRDSGFESILTVYSFDGGIAKPDRAVFARAAAPLLASAVEPGEILVVGNSAANDIAQAKALGFITALFAGDRRSFRPGPEDGGGRPDTLIDSLDRLDATFPPA